MSSMDIGKVNSNFVSNTMDTAKNKVADDSFEKKLQSAFTNTDDKELKKACNEFEGVLLGMMYKQMRATVPKSELLPSDSGRDIFQSMLDEKLVEESTKGKGMGLGNMLYKQLSGQLKSTYKPVGGGEGTKVAEDK